LPGDDESRWWVLCTKPRQEKALSRHLDAHQVPFYLPLIKNSRIYRGRRRTSYNPLFPGYVFMQGGDQERIISLSSARLARILPVEDAEQLRAELRSIARLINSDAPWHRKVVWWPGTGFAFETVRSVAWKEPCSNVEDATGCWSV